MAAFTWWEISLLVSHPSIFILRYLFMSCHGYITGGGWWNPAMWSRSILGPWRYWISTQENLNRKRRVRRMKYHLFVAHAGKLGQTVLLWCVSMWSEEDWTELPHWKMTENPLLLWVWRWNSLIVISRAEKFTTKIVTGGKEMKKSWKTETQKLDTKMNNRKTSHL